MYILLSNYLYTRIYKIIIHILKRIFNYIQFEKVTHMLIYETFTLMYIVKCMFYTLVFHMYNFPLCVLLSIF